MEQVNTFTGGLNMDTDASMIKNNCYTYAENIRILANESLSDGVLQPMDSSVVEHIYSIPGLMFTTVYQIDRFVILFNKVSRSGGSPVDSIIRYNIDTKDIFELAYGDFNIGRYISITGKYEDSDNIKIYFADGINSIRYINVANTYKITSSDRLSIQPSFTLSPVVFESFSDGSLNCGSIEYVYQLFNKNESESITSPSTGIISVFKSTNGRFLNLGDNKDSSSGKSINLSIYIDGKNSSNFNKVRLFAIEYKSFDSEPIVRIVSEYNIPKSGSISINDNGYSIATISFGDFYNYSTSFSFIPNVIEQKDNYLFAANIKETSFDVDYDARAYRYDLNERALINGYDYDLEFTKDQLNNNAILRTYKDGSTDILSDEIPDDFDALNPYNDYNSTSHNLVSAGLGYKYKSVVEDLDVIPNTTRNYDLTLGGEGKNVSYEFIYTNLVEDVNTKLTGSGSSKGLVEFRGMIESNDTFSFDDNAVFGTDRLWNKKNIIRRQVDTDDAEAIYEFPVPSDDKSYNKISKTYKEQILNYNNSSISLSLKGYHRDEIYRFGVVFYNKLGNNTSVKWIGDIRFPTLEEFPMYTRYGNLYVNQSSGTIPVMNGAGLPEEYEVVTHPLGIKFDFKNIPSGASSLEIVVVERDLRNRTILCQGLLSNCMDNIENHYSNYNRGFICPNAFPGFTQNTSIYGALPSSLNHHELYVYKTLDSYYSLISPEIAFTNINIGKSNASKIFLNYFVSSMFKFNAPKLAYPAIGQWKNDRSVIFKSNVGGYKDPGAVAPMANRNVLGTCRVPMFDFNIANDLDDSDRRSYYYEKAIFGSMYFRDLFGVSATDTTYVGKYYTNFNRVAKYDRGGDPSIYKKIKAISNNVSIDSYDISEAKNSTNISSNIVSINDNRISFDELKSAYGVTIGDKLFINIAVSLNVKAYNEIDNLASNIIGTYSRVGAVGPSTKQVILRINDSKFMSNIAPLADYTAPFVTPSAINTREERRNLFNMFVASMLHCNIKTNSYIGGTYAVRQNSTYISTNNHFEIKDSSVTANCYNGDTYINIFDSSHTHKYEFANIDKCTDYAYQSYVVSYTPMESSINMSLRTTPGLSKSYNGISNNISDLDKATVEGDSIYGYTQKYPLYAYNTAYSASSKKMIFVPNSEDYDQNKHYINRIRYSGAKITDELRDSWSKFKPNNFIDVDIKHGDITCIKSYLNKLLFFQTSSVGEVSVNKRSLVTDNSFTELVLGTGGVLDNYDYYSTSTGISLNDIKSICEGGNGLYWYDANSKLINVFNGKNIEPISKTKGIQSFVNSLDNSIGNILSFDKKNDEVNFNLNSFDKMLNYSERINAFQTFITYKPIDHYSVYSKYYSVFTKEGSMYIMNHNISNDSYGRFYESGFNNSVITFVVNDNYIYPKVYDNFDILVDSRIIPSMDVFVSTTMQDPSIVESVVFNNREGIVTIGIPRVQSTGSDERYRGNSLLSNIIFKNNGEYFKIPYIKTKYRVSKL